MNPVTSAEYRSFEPMTAAQMKRLGTAAFDAMPDLPRGLAQYLIDGTLQKGIRDTIAAARQKWFAANVGLEVDGQFTVPATSAGTFAGMYDEKRQTHGILADLPEIVTARYLAGTDETSAPFYLARHRVEWNALYACFEGKHALSAKQVLAMLCAGQFDRWRDSQFYFFTGIGPAARIFIHLKATGSRNAWRMREYVVVEGREIKLGRNEYMVFAERIF